MARKARHPSLNVFMNGRLVGLLRREPSGAVDFTYDNSWLDWPFALPVSLSLPLREDRYIGAAVIAVFDNLLPDNDSIRRQIAIRVRASGTDAFSLLGAIGRDCVGALQFLPVDDEAPCSDGMETGSAPSTLPSLSFSMTVPCWRSNHRLPRLMLPQCGATTARSLTTRRGMVGKRV